MSLHLKGACLIPSQVTCPKLGGKQRGYCGGVQKAADSMCLFLHWHFSLPFSLKEAKITASLFIVCTVVDYHLIGSWEKEEKSSNVCSSHWNRTWTTGSFYKGLLLLSHLFNVPSLLGDVSLLCHRGVLQWGTESSLPFHMLPHIQT